MGAVRDRSQMAFYGHPRHVTSWQINVSITERRRTGEQPETKHRHRQRQPERLDMMLHEPLVALLRGHLLRFLHGIMEGTWLMFSRRLRFLIHLGASNAALRHALMRSFSCRMCRRSVRQALHWHVRWL